MTTFSPSLSFAHQLDSQDPLASYRDQFIITDPDLIYLDGNSLGRMPKSAAERAKQVIDQEWGSDLIRGWNKGWWDAPHRVGDKIGKLIGAEAGQVIVCDTTTANLFKLVVSALQHQPGRAKIVADTLNFPSDLYVLQGIANLSSRMDSLVNPEIDDASVHVDVVMSGKTNRPEPKPTHSIYRVGSKDGDITPDDIELHSAINFNTALVVLSHVAFKSGYLYDMAAITSRAHTKGALVLWDLSHSVGSVPIELDACNADLAIGCTYKYLNGGPGAPAFLYVNKNLQQKLTSPIWGWGGQKNPFDFGLDYEPAAGAQRFLAGTQPMISLLTMEAGIEPTLQAGMDSIRAKSILMTDYASFLTDSWLAPLGFSLGSPRDSAMRGSHISIRHADGYRINRALIEEMNVIPDFRAPDNIRLGFAPLYTSFTEIWQGFDRIKRVVEEKRHEKYPKQKLTVT
ncbi:MAG TPA: aminotransferase class V-fold PLP-dependent enzyme [Anaerolineales bacterium]|nr:aminotransferase class V-fold PLP-dependent enzyme [Anaerolineales bacterium]